MSILARKLYTISRQPTMTVLVEGLCSGRNTLSSSYSQGGAYLTSHFRIINVQYYCLLKFEIGTKYLIVFSLKVTHLRCNLLQLPNRFQLPCNAGFKTLLFFSFPLWKMLKVANQKPY